MGNSDELTLTVTGYKGVKPVHQINQDPRALWRKVLPIYFVVAANDENDNRGNDSHGQCLGWTFSGPTCSEYMNSHHQLAAQLERGY
jgi:hypothetical protein